VLGSLGLAVVAGAAFLLHEAGARQPMLDCGCSATPA
jgi:hypothetical protein